MSTIPVPSRVLISRFDESLSADEEGAFFASLHQSNGTTKMTSPGRLTDVDAAIATHLPPVSRLKALDVGISSGISTFEWLLSLERLGYICSMTAFDRVLYTRLYQFGGIEVLAETDAYVLLIHTGCRAFTRPTRQIKSWRNRVVQAIFQFSDALARLCNKAAAGRDVRLVSGQLRSRPDVQCVEHDLFDSAPDWIEQFDVVRVANTLNRSYFSEPTLRLGLQNVGRWVRQGGILAVARTQQDGQNHATIFRREPTGFRAIHRVGAGSEVEGLVPSAMT